MPANRKIPSPGSKQFNTQAELRAAVILKCKAKYKESTGWEWDDTEHERWQPPRYLLDEEEDSARGSVNKLREALMEIGRFARKNAHPSFSEEKSASTSEEKSAPTSEEKSASTSEKKWASTIPLIKRARAARETDPDEHRLADDTHVAGLAVLRIARVMLPVAKNFKELSRRYEWPPKAPSRDTREAVRRTTLVRIGQRETATDEHVAVVSLLLGNYPVSVVLEGTQEDNVIATETNAIRAARRSLGLKAPGRSARRA